MASRTINHTKPYTLALGIAFTLVTLLVLGFALMRGGLDVRSKAAPVIKYTCMPKGECSGIGTVVGGVYCGSSCKLPSECCKTTANTQKVTPTLKPSIRITGQIFATPTPTQPLVQIVSCNRCSSTFGCQRAIWTNYGASCSPLNPVGGLGAIQRPNDCSCGRISQAVIDANPGNANNNACSICP